MWFGQLILVIEFKIGASLYEAAAVDQVLDYALDLKNFHRGSHAASIVPLLVATDAPYSKLNGARFDDGVGHPLCVNTCGLSEFVARLMSSKECESDLNDALEWASSPYSPTPTIVEAARSLYRGHRVENLSRSDAGAKNLAQTSRRIGAIIDHAKLNGQKGICFVTGVPGSGKTLAGLNIATERMRSHEEEHAVFLSGNGPLVAVLQEALTQDELNRKSDGVKLRRSDASRKAKAFIQNIHHFRDDNLRTSAPPIEKVVVFDEAQRAWDRDQTSKFMKSKRGKADFSMSEPEFLLSVMDRHPSWCVVVCLVGGGQEINTGEAGIQEWLDVLEKHFPYWITHYSSRLIETGDVPNSGSRHLASRGNWCPDDELHLKVSLRSFRSEKLSQFVAAVLENNSYVARALLLEMPSYPICVTRSISTARRWLRQHARGTERTGLIASSNAIRLKPYGIHVKSAIEPELWFLKGKNDVRSSFQLEDVATEFDVQGLELDWASVCWDANLRRHAGDWKECRFKGTVWQNINDLSDARYTRNAYRVLLTRARQGMVIFVPPGDDNDETCRREWYDAIYQYLQECGVPSIDNS